MPNWRPVKTIHGTPWVHGISPNCALRKVWRYSGNPNTYTIYGVSLRNFYMWIKEQNEATTSDMVWPANATTSQPPIITKRLPTFEIVCQSSTSSRLRKSIYPSICQLMQVQHPANQTPMLTCVGTIRKSHQSSKSLTIYYIKYCFIWSSFAFGMILPLPSCYRRGFLQRKVKCFVLQYIL